MTRGRRHRRSSHRPSPSPTTSTQAPCTRCSSRPSTATSSSRSRQTRRRACTRCCSHGQCTSSSPPHPRYSVWHGRPPGHWSSPWLLPTAACRSMTSSGAAVGQTSCCRSPPTAHPCTASPSTRRTATCSRRPMRKDSSRCGGSRRSSARWGLTSSRSLRSSPPRAPRAAPRRQPRRTRATRPATARATTTSNSAPLVPLGPWSRTPGTAGQLSICMGVYGFRCGLAGRRGSED
mmetsp:Transcript_77292/g.186743  ORF Transcript_77292/g.186743 Transcript_77292/m.186743 type:complete len:234 (+) Transcript_77292:1291-1992(+)